ncbi:PAS domain-containing sensor histidine kinase [Candidatus Parcubacteria bacterium]|nr:MAG: PAS domain-containing sensor histidine kinase [Candidatus Parcubacteria bacterium]
MVKLDREKIGWIAGGIIAFALTNGVLFYLYPKSFSTFAYILFIFVPLIAIVAIVFVKFSLLFIERIDEKEEEGKVLQERQREIVENMVEGLIVHNSSGRILTVNGMAEQFLGLSAPDLKNKTVAEVNNPQPLLRAIFMPMKDKEETEFSYKDKDGQDLFYQLIQVPLSKERGEILKIIRDVTRAKYLDRMKNEYITIMSHKILTPLTNIKWAAGMLMGKGLDEAKKESGVKNITANTDELIEFTSHLLNITEIEEGLFGYKFEKVDMAELVKEAAKNYQDAATQRNIKILCEVPEDVFPVRGDKNRLGAAVANYLDNAVKYSPNGGNIAISLSKDKYKIWFSVKDNGVGVSPESVNSLFTKFFRDKRAKAVHTEGTGAGLFIVKNIIEKHGGKVGYEPAPRGGSMFYFTLPVYNGNE